MGICVFLLYYDRMSRVKHNRIWQNAGGTRELVHKSSNTHDILRKELRTEFQKSNSLPQQKTKEKHCIKGKAKVSHGSP